MNLRGINAVPASIAMKGPRMKPSSAGSTGVSESRNRVAFEPSNSVAEYDALLTRMPTIDDVLDGQASALGNRIVKGATLKVFPGAPHGMCSTLKDQVNSELLAFFKGAATAAA